MSDPDRLGAVFEAVECLVGLLLLAWLVSLPVVAALICLGVIR